MTFVIPVHNRRHFTQACLAALRRQTDKDFRIILIDDGSQDGTAQMVREEFPEVEVLRGDGSLWWAEATNAGIRRALTVSSGPVVCLNDDTVPPPDFVAQLRLSMERHPATLISCAAVDIATGAAMSSGERVNWLLASHPSLVGDPAEVVDVTHAQGRGLLIPDAVFAAIGLFDSRRFPHYAADYDFTHRARRAGFRIICDRNVVLQAYPAASGDAQNRIEKSWRNYANHLFGTRGGGNLGVFLRYASRHCPWPLLPACLAVGLTRRILGYPLHWMLSLLPQREGA